MYSAAGALFIAETDALRAFLSATSQMRSLLPNVQDSLERSELEDRLLSVREVAPEPVLWRVMEHTLAVGRLYAIYESFCESLLGDWIEFLTSRLKFLELPKKIRDGYPAGFATMLNLLPSPRYPDLNVKDIVAAYHSALQGDEPYSLTAACLVYHKNNLRWNELAELFSRCGIVEVEAWIEKSSLISEYFQGGEGRLVDLVTARLSVFVQYRNDSSHGLVEVDEILGLDELQNVIDFIASLSLTLDQLVMWNMLELKVKLGQARLVGQVTEVFRKAGAIVCVCEEGHLHLGQSVIFKKEGNLTSSTILSLRLDDVDYESVDVLSGKEVGMLAEILPSKGSYIYAVNP